jgi:hypothetical protein
MYLQREEGWHVVEVVVGACLCLQGGSRSCSKPLPPLIAYRWPGDSGERMGWRRSGRERAGIAAREESGARTAGSARRGGDLRHDMGGDRVDGWGSTARRAEVGSTMSLPSTVRERGHRAPPSPGLDVTPPPGMGLGVGARHLHPPPSIRGRGVAPTVGVAGVGVWRRLWRGGWRWLWRGGWRPRCFGDPRAFAGREGARHLHPPPSIRGKRSCASRRGCGRRGVAAALARWMAAADGKESRRARARMERNRGVLARGWKRNAGAEGGEIAAVRRCGRRGHATDLARRMATADGKNRDELVRGGKRIAACSRRAEQGCVDAYTNNI